MSKTRLCPLFSLLHPLGGHRSNSNRPRPFFYAVLVESTISCFKAVVLCPWECFLAQQAFLRDYFNNTGSHLHSSWTAPFIHTFVATICALEFLYLLRVVFLSIVVVGLL